MVKIVFFIKTLYFIFLIDSKRSEKRNGLRVLIFVRQPLKVNFGFEKRFDRDKIL